jgi:hypothetical protein
MNKQTIQYDSPLDALVAIAKRLSRYEVEAGLSSEAFFSRYSQGTWGDDAQSIEWANDYRHNLALREFSRACGWDARTQSLHDG